MKKLITILFFTLYMGASNAEMSYGISGALAHVNASGTETEGGEKSSASTDNIVVIPSLFVEYGFSDFSVGLDYIPLSADVSDKTYKRTDIETSVTGTAASTSTTRNQTAEAELSNHLTLYADYMVNDDIWDRDDSWGRWNTTGSI